MCLHFCLVIWLTNRKMSEKPWKKKIRVKQIELSLDCLIHYFSFVIVNHIVMQVLFHLNNFDHFLSLCITVFVSHLKVYQWFESVYYLWWIRDYHIKYILIVYKTSSTWHFNGLLLTRIGNDPWQINRSKDSHSSNVSSKKKR